MALVYSRAAARSAQLGSSVRAYISGASSAQPLPGVMARRIPPVRVGVARHGGVLAGNWAVLYMPAARHFTSSKGEWLHPPAVPEDTLVQNAKRAYSDYFSKNPSLLQAVKATLDRHFESPLDDISRLSEQNIKKIEGDLVALSRDENSVYEQVLAFPFVIRHSTSNLPAIIEQGEILSNTALVRQGKQHYSRTKTYDTNQDFVFFSLMPSISHCRGGASVILPIDLDITKHSHTTIHDQNCMRHPTYQSTPQFHSIIKIGNTTIEQSFVAIGVDAKGGKVSESDGITFKFKVDGQKEKSFAVPWQEQHLYGADIRKGFALMFVKIFRCLDPEAQALLCKNPEQMAELFGKVFDGVEYKVPVSVRLGASANIVDGGVISSLSEAKEANTPGKVVEYQRMVEENKWYQGGVSHD